nr:hypothetical protein Hi04_10k_c3780_00018 [uncultured bacterium]
MKASPRVGTVGELKFIVEQKHVIDFAADGMPAVLSTPILIGLLERTAREALMQFLEKDERSVGSEIELRHFAPAPAGQEVTCIARVVSAEGNTVTFQIEARDKHELIARGLHKRAVIQVEKFAKHVARKAAGE